MAMKKSNVLIDALIVRVNCNNRSTHTGKLNHTHTQTYIFAYTHIHRMKTKKVKFTTSQFQLIVTDVIVYSKPVLLCVAHLSV